MKNSLWTAYSLWSREIVRFYRQPSRIVGVIGTHFVFWIFIGAGFGRSFQAGDLTQKGGLDYLTYFYPGIVFLIILFTAIFSTFSLIQDRQEGYLQAVLVAPVARWGIVLGKVLGGSTLAFIQTFLFLIIALAMGILDLSLPWFLAGFVIFLNAFALTTL